jgi:hypothetical protein
MIGDTRSTRDKIAAAHVLTSLFIMEITPDGTNQPHHHDREEEIYLLLEGTGDMVAGGGVNGVEGRYPATPGDAGRRVLLPAELHGGVLQHRRDEGAYSGSPVAVSVWKIACTAPKRGARTHACATFRGGTSYLPNGNSDGTARIRAFVAPVL